MNQIINLTKQNFTTGRSGHLVEYLVFHYTANVGDTAESNANYFKSIYRGASAHYFVDESKIVQAVKDSDTAWHCGDYQRFAHGGATQKNIVRNQNSIGIEMCSNKENGKFVITEQTQKNAIELGKALMKKYNIPITRVFRHFDVSGKLCPLPFVDNPTLWKEFKERLSEEEVETTIINATMNGKPVKLTSIVYNDENYIRIRDLSNAQNDDKLTVSWDNKTKTVVITSK
ncbi:MAG: N-acetylmuramoyl-L-alanine amidase family protein [Aminipila sp.]